MLETSVRGEMKTASIVCCVHAHFECRIPSVFEAIVTVRILGAAFASEVSRIQCARSITPAGHCVAFFDLSTIGVLLNFGIVERDIRS